jgi:hypothetical protein
MRILDRPDLPRPSPGAVGGNGRECGKIGAGGDGLSGGKDLEGIERVLFVLPCRSCSTNYESGGWEFESLRARQFHTEMLGFRRLCGDAVRQDGETAGG